MAIFNVVLVVIVVSRWWNVDAFHHQSISCNPSLVFGDNKISLRHSRPPVLARTHEPNNVLRRRRQSSSGTRGRFAAFAAGSVDATTSANILVIGGTSGIGQLVTQKLASNNNNNIQYTVRATSRSKGKGEELFTDSGNNIKVIEINLLNEDTTQLREAMQDVSVVVVSVGTTAFPTAKWKGGNTPIAIDNAAVSRIANIASQVASVQKVILVTSVGVDRIKEMPFLILNLFGVLDAKRAGEDAVKQYATINTGYQYTIIRPGRLVGGPFTNLDVAKLLQIQGGTENGVSISRGDTLLGDCKRDACAECIVQCITNPSQTKNNLEFSIISNDQPALSDEEWCTAFQSVV